MLNFDAIHQPIAMLIYMLIKSKSINAE